MNANPIIVIIRRHPQLSYYAILICTVSIAFAASSSWMLASGKELVWTQDALPLYANFLIWGHRVVCDAIGQVASGQGFDLPQYTLSMGYGADVPMTMGSYLQDPINLIAAILPENAIGFSYSFMVYVRVVLSAVAFSIYCFSRGHGRKTTGVAALAYATCGFLLLLGAFRHPKFMDWAVLLPLLLLGADRLFERRSPVLFIAALFLQFLVSIYYSYMSCIVILVYSLVKYFFKPRNRSVRDFATLVGAFLASGAVAFMLCGLFAVPQIVALLSQNRATSGGASVPLLFTLKYYTKIIPHFLGAAGTTEGMVIGSVSTIGLLAFLLCGKQFTQSERTPWLIGLLMCFLGILIPFFSHVMNGMGYATDRWMLVFAFVSSYILCVALPQITSLSPAEWRRLGLCASAFFAITCLYGCAQFFLADGLPGTIWPLTAALAFAGIFIAIKKLASRGNLAHLAVLCGAAIIACSTLTCVFYCSPLGMNWGSSFPKAGSTWDSLTTNTPGAAAEKIDDDSPWRYSVPRVYDSMKNSALAHNVMGVDYYTSFYNQYVDDFRQELGISDHHMNFSFVGSDSRLAVEGFTGVKYYICKKRDEWRVPYGFEKTDVEFNGYKVYENANAAPLALLMSDVMDSESYQSLSMAQKQEALLQAVIVEGNDLEELGDYDGADIEYASESPEFQVTDSKGMELDLKNGIAHVYERGATVTLRFNGLERAETYLTFENLSFEEYSPSTLAALGGNSATLKSSIQDVLWTRSTTYPITAKSGERTKASNPATPEHLRYGGKTDWVFNLCYSEEPLGEMTVEFDERGDYTFDRMQVICQPVEPIAMHLNSMSERSLDDLALETNGMSATVTVDDDEPHIALFTFAYTPGWSVSVDGQPRKALRVDTAFLGVEIEGAGKHIIEWSYTTPGLAIGGYLSGLGVVIAAAAAIARLLLKRRGKRLDVS